LAEEGKGKDAAAKAVFSFQYLIARGDLVALIVSVDGEPAMLKMARPEK
jgi:hypothetical protein